MPTLGKLVKDKRDERKWSQDDLAKQARCSAMTVSRLERGIHWPKLPTLKRVCAALDIDLKEAYALPGSPSPGQSMTDHQGEAAWVQFCLTRQAMAADPNHVQALRARRYPGTPTVHTYLLGLLELESLEDPVPFVAEAPEAEQEEAKQEEEKPADPRDIMLDKLRGLLFDEG